MWAFPPAETVGGRAITAIFLFPSRKTHAHKKDFRSIPNANAAGGGGQPKERLLLLGENNKLLEEGILQL